jgi:Uma2 family endonuclease
VSRRSFVPRERITWSPVTAADRGPAPAAAELESPCMSRRLHHTYAEYLALEEESSTRHEYLDGEIYALAGGSPDHAALAAAVIGLVAGQLSPACRVFTSDLRIRIQASGLSTYPDVAVVCGRTQRAPDDALAVINPVVLVEVTSASTEEYDGGEKLRQYKLLPSVREVLIVSHREPLLTLHRREDPDAWTTLRAQRGEILDLASISARVKVDELYRGGLEDSGQAG